MQLTELTVETAVAQGPATLGAALALDVSSPVSASPQTVTRQTIRIPDTWLVDTTALLSLMQQHSSQGAASALSIPMDTVLALSVPSEHPAESATTAPPIAPETLPPWFDATIGKIRALKELKSGWDSYGAAPIASEAVDGAELIVRLAATPNMPEPAVVATSTGGVQLEWHTLDCDAEIEVFPAYSRLYFETVGSLCPLDIPDASRSVILKTLLPLRK